ncbi:MAG: metallophosphoesterase [Candidatus Omnitrophota bacterium]
MKRLLKIAASILAILVMFSLLPVLSLYLQRDPRPYTNADAAAKLAANKGEYFAFTVLGDNHAGLIFNDSAALKMIRRINMEDRFGKIPVDMAIISGDATYRGSAWDYRIFNRVRSLIKRPVITAMGNHDDDKDDGSLFKKYAGEKEFAFADRNSYFIFLDDSSNDLTEAQFSWFEEELKKSLSYTHAFVIMHKAPVSLYQQSWFRPELSPWARRFMRLCEQYRVSAVFTGHEHLFKSQTLGRVHYIMSGGGGMLTQVPAREGGFLHYIVVRVNGTYVDYEVRKVFPPLWEYLAYYMWKDLFYFLKDVIL